jgi:hypothetical protein
LYSKGNGPYFAYKIKKHQNNKAMVVRILAVLLAAALTGIGIDSHAQEFTKEDSKPDMALDKVKHDFGKIPQGKPAAHSFKITNTGDAPLVIKDVRPSCGCTTPKWPKKPIAPGESAEIKAVYDAKSTGAFQKSIVVDTNVPFSESKKLTISGVVKQPEQEG